MPSNVHPRSLLALLLAPTLFAACSDDEPTDTSTDAGNIEDTGTDDPSDSGGEVIDPMSWDVSERGPYEVGFRTWEFTYRPPGFERDRTIDFLVWYPAESTTEIHPSYLPGDPLFGAEDENVYLDAPAASAVHEGGYPVLTYSHGHRAWGGSYADGMAWFASHGWVAIAPHHREDMWPDFTITGDYRGENPVNGEQPTYIWYTRMTDVSAALDVLASLPADDPLANAHTDEVVLAGHSRGVHTVWGMSGANFDLEYVEGRCSDERCTEEHLAAFAENTHEPRVVAATGFAGTIGGWFGTDGEADIAIPILSMTGDADAGPDGPGQFERMSDAEFPLTWLDFHGGCHETFTLGQCTTLDPRSGLDLTHTYHLAFARHHLLGDESEQVTGLLDGSIILDESLVTLERNAAAEAN